MDGLQDPTAVPISFEYVIIHLASLSLLFTRHKIFLALGNTRPQILFQLEDSVLQAIIHILEGMVTEEAIDGLYSQILLLKEDLVNDPVALNWFDFSHTSPLITSTTALTGPYVGLSLNPMSDKGEEDRLQHGEAEAADGNELDGREREEEQEQVRMGREAEHNNGGESNGMGEDVVQVPMDQVAEHEDGGGFDGMEREVVQLQVQAPMHEGAEREDGNGEGAECEDGDVGEYDGMEKEVQEEEVQEQMCGESEGPDLMEEEEESVRMRWDTESEARGECDSIKEPDGDLHRAKSNLFSPESSEHGDMDEAMIELRGKKSPVGSRVETQFSEQDDDPMVGNEPDSDSDESMGSPLSPQDEEAAHQDEDAAHDKAPKDREGELSPNIVKLMLDNPNLSPSETSRDEASERPSRNRSFPSRSSSPLSSDDAGTQPSGARSASSRSSKKIVPPILKPTKGNTSQNKHNRGNISSNKRKNPPSPRGLGSKEHPIDVEKVGSLFEPIVIREYV